MLGFLLVVQLCPNPGERWSTAWHCEGTLGSARYMPYWHRSNLRLAPELMLVDERRIHTRKSAVIDFNIKRRVWRSLNKLGTKYKFPILTLGWDSTWVELMFFARFPSPDWIWKLRSRGDPIDGRLSCVASSGPARPAVDSPVRSALASLISNASNLLIPVRWAMFGSP